MKKQPTSLYMESCRVTEGPLASDGTFGYSGAFRFRLAEKLLQVIAATSDGWVEQGLPLPAWEHVSVSLPDRCPTWTEMDYVKGLFWDQDELVLQLHVPKSEHVNHQQFCLHLWKPVGVEIPLPPPITVGPR